MPTAQLGDGQLLDGVLSILGVVNYHPVVDGLADPEHKVVSSVLFLL